MVIMKMRNVQEQKDFIQPNAKKKERMKSNTHLSMKFLHLVFPSALFIQSSSSLTSLSYGSSASLGKVFMMCSKISWSYLSWGWQGGRKRRDRGQPVYFVQNIEVQREGEIPR
jgi:hypothetical protein